MQRPKLCQACGSTRIVILRPGVSRLREELEAAAGRPVVEVTAASVASALDLADADVYIGTEAVLHRVRRIDTAAFLDLDGELLAPRYRAAEQTLGLLARAARLVGGRTRGGRLIVQTYLPDHPVVDAVRFADPSRARLELEAQRRPLGFPPFGALAAVSGTGADEYAAALRERPDLRVLGPADRRYLIRADTPEALADALGDTPRPADSRLRLEVDPPRL
jgi:primosomal protein N' (replication factor Y)